MTLTLCPLKNFSLFFRRLLIFFSKSPFSKNYFRNTICVSNRLDPDKAQCFVSPDLGSSCLQRLSADDTRRQGVNLCSMVFWKWLQNVQ